MPNLNTKFLIVIASVVLVILIAVTIFINSLVGGKSSGESALVPTGILNEQTSGDGFTGTGSLANEGNLVIENEEEPKEDIEEIASASAEFESDFAQLKDIVELTPLETADFAIGYSPALNEFFVSTKTPRGVQKFREYLAQNDLQDMYKNYPNVFNVGTDPLDEFIQDTENEVVTLSRQIEAETRRRVTGRKKFNEEQEKEIARDDRILDSFVGFTGAILKLDRNAPVTANDLIPSENTTTTGGGNTPGGSNGGGNENLPNPQTYNGGGTPQLKRIMSVIKAISGLTWGGICVTSGHMANSEHYRCNAVDVSGGEALLDNTFAKLLATAKRNELPIHCLIYERFSYSRESNWAKHAYSGASNHDSHIHISGWPSVGGNC